MANSISALTSSVSWTYNTSSTKTGEYKQIGTYRTGAIKQSLKYVEIKLGTGSGRFNDGDDVAGQGIAFTTKLRINGVESSQIYIATVIGTKKNSRNNTYYPNPANFSTSYQFNFTNLYLNPNTTYNVEIFVPSRYNNTYGTGYSTVLCMNLNNNIIAYTDTTYTVTLDANRGSPNSYSYSEKPYGAQITLPTPEKRFALTYNTNGGSSIPTVYRSCKLLNWNTKSDGSGISYLPNSQYTVVGNITLYAIWADPKVGVLPVPTKPGYVFDKWTNQASNIQITESTEISSDTTIYAKYIELNLINIWIMTGTGWEPYNPGINKCIWRYNGSEWLQVQPVYIYSSGEWKNIREG